MEISDIKNLTPITEKESNIPKKKWEKPKLIVLVRGDRQERVLIACKGGDFGEPQGTDRFYFKALAPGECFSCLAVGLS